MIRPAGSLNGAGNLESYFVEIFLPLIEGNLFFKHQPEEIAICAHVIEAMVMDTDVGKMRRHVIHSVLSTHLKGFLITYCMINVVVLIDGGLGLVSYRPTLQVPLWIPFVGLVGCLFSMFIVNPTFGLVSVVMVLGLFVTLAGITTTFIFPRGLRKIRLTKLLFWRR